MAAHQAPRSLGFSRQEYWSGVPLPSPMHESETWKWSCSVMSDSFRPHGLQPTRLLRPWDFPGKSTGVGCHRLLRHPYITNGKTIVLFGCESWTIKKAECQTIDAFRLVLEKTVESSLDSTEIKPVNPKDNQPWLFIEYLKGLLLKLQYFGHLMRRTYLLEKTLMLGRI